MIELVTLDAFGTVVQLDDPVRRLVASLAERGATVSEAEAATALRAEMSHYRRNLDRGADSERLAALRSECAQVLGAALPPRAAAVPDLEGALMSALRFEVFPDVSGALAALREHGCRLVVLSNWDVSLHEMLAATGLDRLVDGAVSSAEIGAAKPDPRAFAAALEIGDCADPARALHVGDDPDGDVAGARAAGMHALLVDRGATRAPGALADLEPLPELVAAGPESFYRLRR